MIGDTIANVDNSANTGSLSDWTADIVTLTKVNQDNYQSEYRYRGADFDYKVLIRNSVETPRSDGQQFTRHNIECTATLRGDSTAVPPTKDVPYIFSMTARMPKGGVVADMVAWMGAWTEWLNATAGAKLVKMVNFES